MPRFFFHVLDGKASIDHVGIELADVEAAEKEAMRTAGDIIRSGKTLGRYWSRTVVDEKDLVLLRLNFDALTRSIRREPRLGGFWRLVVADGEEALTSARGDSPYLILC